jgi:endoglucanase
MRRPPTSSLLAAAAVLVTAGGIAALPSVPAGAATPCTVAYSVTSQWSSGFQGSVVITNGSSATSSWTLTFDFPGGQKVTQGWNGSWSQSGTTVTVSNASWNGTIGTGASVSAGFLADGTGTGSAPTAFKLGGVTCNEDSPSPPPTSPPTSPPAGPAPALTVSGNKLVDATGATRRLLGVNRSGGEFMCVQGRGIWDGPVDDASIAAMRTWKINTVRIPLNEECWLGNSNIDAAYRGATYIAAVKDYVTRLEAHGITPVVELHWTHGQYTGNSAGCSDLYASCQKPMPDAEYGPAFWTSVANTFKGDQAVVFDLFNEPYPDRATSSLDDAWKCWRDGGTCSGIGYQVAGMQTLVNAVRSTGARNVIMLGGLAYSNDLGKWLTYRPADPAGNLAASVHVYNFNTCGNSSCWDSTLAPVAAQVPLVAGETGENTCGHSFVDQLMSWFDAHGVSYLAWTWNTWDCSSGPSLISAYDGTATAYGAGLKAHLQAIA